LVRCCVAACVAAGALIDMGFVRRLSHLLRNRSPAQIAAVVVANVRHLAYRMSAERRRAVEMDLAFDREHGTDTAGTRPVSSMTVPPEIAAKLHGYQATGAAFFENALAIAQIDPERFSFIDYGSGKGRTLLIAAKRPFQRVIGIEIAQELHEVAQRNIALFKQRTDVACTDIQSLCLDARGYAPPAGDLLVYFYNPFLPEIFEPVLATLEQAARSAPRELLAYYIEPKFPQVFDGRAGWRQLHAQGLVRLYRYTPETPA
jgi:SAM-dependent methyltransferase